jgi:hypothetical protein
VPASRLGCLCGSACGISRKLSKGLGVTSAEVRVYGFCRSTRVWVFEAGHVLDLTGEEAGAALSFCVVVLVAVAVMLGWECARLV